LDAWSLVAGAVTRHAVVAGSIQTKITILAGITVVTTVAIALHVLIMWNYTHIDVTGL